MLPTLVITLDGVPVENVYEWSVPDGFIKVFAPLTVRDRRKGRVDVYVNHAPA